jgi:FMN reductase
MAKTLTIVGLGGSLAKVSTSRAALRVALEGAAAAGAEIELLDLRELDLPMYNPDHDEPPEAAARLIESSYAADGMLWSSPLYQGTISGAFKNALDWLHLLGGRDPAYLHDTVVGLISAAGGTQGLQAVNTMEFSIRALRAWAVPYSCLFRLPRVCSIRTAQSATRESSCSSGRSAAKSSASPSCSRRTICLNAKPNAIALPNASRQPPCETVTTSMTTTIERHVRLDPGAHSGSRRSTSRAFHRRSATTRRTCSRVSRPGSGSLRRRARRSAGHKLVRDRLGAPEVSITPVLRTRQ